MLFRLWAYSIVLLCYWHTLATLCCFLCVYQAADQILMSCAWLNLCKKVGIICATCWPDDVENILACFIPNSVISHVVWLWFLELNRIVSYADCRNVIGIDRCWLLWVVKSGQDRAFEVGVLAVDVEWGIFCFRCWSAYGCYGAAYC